MINIKPKELQEKQFAKCKNYKKAKLTNQKQIKSKTKKNTMNEKRRKKQQQNN